MTAPAALKLPSISVGPIDGRQSAQAGNDQVSAAFDAALEQAASGKDTDRNGGSPRVNVAGLPRLPPAKLNADRLAAPGDGDDLSPDRQCSPLCPDKHGLGDEDRREQHESKSAAALVRSPLPDAVVSIIAVPTAAIEAQQGSSRGISGVRNAWAVAVHADSGLLLSDRIDATPVAELDRDAFRVEVVRHETHLPTTRIRGPQSEEPGSKPEPGRAQLRPSVTIERAVAQPLAGEVISKVGFDLSLANEEIRLAGIEARGVPASPAAQILQAIVEQSGDITDAATTIASQRAEHAVATATAPSPLKTINIELSPHTLGVVRIEMASDAAALRIRIEAEQVRTAHYLDREQDYLADRLAAAGFHVDELFVGLASTTGGSTERQDVAGMAYDRSFADSVGNGRGERWSGRQQDAPRRDAEPSDGAASTASPSPEIELPSARGADSFPGRRSFGFI